MERFVAAGLYNPDAPNAAERKEFLEYLVERGHTVDEIIAAAEADHASDILFHIAWDLRAPTVPRLSAREIAERSGSSVDEVLEVRACLAVPFRIPMPPRYPSGSSR